MVIIFLALASLVSTHPLDLLVPPTRPPSTSPSDDTCSDTAKCNMTFIETMPDVLKYGPDAPSYPSLSEHWRNLLRAAKKEVNIMSFYWSMKSEDVAGGPYPEAEIGEKVLADIRAAADRGVKVRIVQNHKSSNTKELCKHENIRVRSINIPRLLNENGITHTKFFSVDKKNAYFGSANFNWRQLTENRELGIAMYDCPCVVADAMKIFETNWMLSKNDKTKIPKDWPEEYKTKYNKDNPIEVAQEGHPDLRVYWAMSPPAFCAPGRSSDIKAILDIIHNAKEFVYIEGMYFYNAFKYTKVKRYWDEIERALKAAAYDRGVNVYLMASKMRQSQLNLLKSMHEFGKFPPDREKGGSLKVKLFDMPKHPNIKKARYSHSKYMVSENAAYISTSNWSGDFYNTGGISLIISEERKMGDKGSMVKEVKDIFLRDWNSPYAEDIDGVPEPPPEHHKK